MNRIMSSLRFLRGPLAALLLAACAESAPVEPLAPGPAPQLSSSGATLLECPIDSTASVTRTIDLLGGTLELDGHRVTIPANAVLLPTEFTLTVPASNYMKIRVAATGQDHFEFLEPVELRISYSRCSRSNIEKTGLRIYHVDEATNAVLEDLGGVDDKTARVVTTETDHFSDYAIGQP